MPRASTAFADASGSVRRYPVAERHSELRIVDTRHARVLLAGAEELMHPETALAAAKLGCDLAVLSSGMELSAMRRQTIAARSVDQLYIAVAAADCAFICEPPESHYSWKEVCADGGGVCSLTPWRGAKTTFTYVLAPRGTKVSGMPRDAVFVEMPVRGIVLASSTQVAAFSLLDIEDAIVGISGCNLINTLSVAERIRIGRIREVGDGGSGMDRAFDMERMLELDPNLVMTAPTGDLRYDHHGQLKEAGFSVVFNSEYMETTPLGCSEWIKFTAAFFDMETEAERLFSETVSRYETLAAKARGVVSRPTVFSGSNYRGTWHMPGGGSYVAAAFRDAGACYLWENDNSVGSMPLHIEAVLERAGNADIWIDPSGTHSMEELTAQGERCAVFRAFRSGRVFNNDVKISPGGGNDIWEGGIAHPELVLADLISIIHPELLPGHQRIWYRQLPEKAETR